MKPYMPSSAGNATTIPSLTRAMVGIGRNAGDIAATMKQHWPDDRQALQIAQRGSIIPSGAAGGGAVEALQASALNTVHTLVGKASALGFIITHAIPIQFKNSVASEKVLKITTTAAGNIVEPGEPIPNVMATIDGVDVVPHKIAFAFSMTAESIAGDNAETLVSLAMRENLKLSGEGLLFSSTVGIRDGVAAIAATAAGATAMADDLANLGSAVAVAAGDLSNVCYIADPVSALRIMLAMPLLKIPVIASAALAPNEVLAVAVNAVAIGGGDEIRFNVSSEAVMHMDTAPLQIGGATSPVRSMFQTDCKSYRLIFDMGWSKRSADAVAWMTVNW